MIEQLASGAISTYSVPSFVDSLQFTSQNYLTTIPERGLVAGSYRGETSKVPDIHAL